jgi:hypothetical protein
VITILADTVRTQGLRGVYAGSGALIAGNGLKAGVRFMTYDSIKEVLRNPEVSLSRLDRVADTYRASLRRPEQCWRGCVRAWWRQ